MVDRAIAMSIAGVSAEGGKQGKHSISHDLEIYLIHSMVINAFLGQGETMPGTSDKAKSFVKARMPSVTPKSIALSKRRSTYRRDT